MANITITIPVAQEQRVADAFTFALADRNEASPAVIADVKAYIIADLKQFVRTAERAQAALAVVPAPDPDIT